MSKRILVVAAHGDDEVLGCGGAIARHTAASSEVGVLFLTNGVGSRKSAGDVEIERRQMATNLALEVLGVAQSHRCDFPDNAMDTVPLLTVIREISKFCEQFGMPDRVYTHFSGDLNVDHQVAHRAVLTCFRPEPACDGRPCEILAFEVLSSTGWLGAAGGAAFDPNFFVDISDVLDKKLEAFRAYEDEVRDWPHARSVEAIVHQSRFRGAMVGRQAAEAFVVQRIVEDIA
jgi:LmbE family N-acetylglucosaminyl deacetylase